MKKIINTEQLIQLYKKGFFPMAENASTDEVNFYKPDKRFIIPINCFHIPKKLLSEFKKGKFQFTINNNFSSVIENCTNNRKPLGIYKDSETWINQIIKDTYIKLYTQGYAKSIECFYANKLVGGLYGLHIGACFFGESMFSHITNTSKLCLLFLISILKYNNYKLLDSQFYNTHLLQFGAYEISDQKYQERLKAGINKKCIFPETFDYQKSFLILQSLSHKS